MAKRFLALLLAVLMLAALSASAFAESSKGKTGTITVLNPIEGETYTAYKIFAVTYDNNNDTIPLAEGDVVDNYAYTISSTSPWLDVVNSFFDTAATADETVLTVKPKDDFSAPAFAAALKEALSSLTVDGVELKGETPTATGLDLGYWFVSPTNGSLCNLTTTNPTQNIYDKNQPLTLDKTVDDEDLTVEVGQVLTYTITADLPKDVTGYEHFYYVIGDTMTDGLTYRDIKGATIGTTDLGKLTAPVKGFTYIHGGIDPTPDYENMNGFNVVIDFATENDDGTLAFADYLGKTLTITYRAIVNEDAIERAVETNTATLKYSNDPNDSTSYKELPDVTVDVYTLNLGVTKVSSKKSTTYLEDAEFVLYKQDESSTKEYYLYGERDGFKDVKWVKLPVGKADVSAALKDDENFCTVRKTVTGTGKLNERFYGIEAGKYYLEEIKSPLGYALPAEPFEVIISKVDATEENPVSFSATFGGKIAEYVASTQTLTGTIANVPGQKLPETGGIGTTIFYVVGSIFVLGAVVVLLTKKRA